MVIDSSTLVSLAKIRSLGALERLNADIFCPFEVKKEAVDEGMARHFDDAFEIQKIFEKNLVKVKEIYGHINADEAVLELAKKISAEFILCNDVGLSRRAAGSNIKVKGSADVFFELYRSGELNRKEVLQKLKQLVSKKRLSTKNYFLYFKEVKK